MPLREREGGFYRFWGTLCSLRVKTLSRKFPGRVDRPIKNETTSSRSEKSTRNFGKNCNIFSVGFLGVLFSSVSDWSDLGWPDEGDDATHCPLSLFDKFAWTAKYLIEKQKSPDKKSLESWKGSGNPAPGDQPDDLKPKFSRLLLTPRNPWKSFLAKRLNLLHDFNQNFSSVF